MAPKIEAVVKGCTLAEGPHWDIDTQSLYFVDLFEETIAKYHYSTGRYTHVSFKPLRVSFVIPIHNRKNHFIVPLFGELTIIEWDGESDNYKIVKRLEKVPNYFNDGKVDPTGRLWAGAHDINFENIEATLPVGILYSVNSKCQISKHLDNIKISNGLTFNSKTNEFYYIDSLSYGIKQYDYHKETGTIANGREFFALRENNIPGIPDGMTIDADGNLWVAIFGGGRVIKIDGKKPNTILDTIEIPTKQVTSVAFGGPNLDELFVTTAAISIGNNQPESTGGIVYKISGLGVKGAPMNKFVID